MDGVSAPADLRSDVRVIGLIGFVHGTSHFFHLLLPPLFPWLMPEFGLNFTEAGALMTAFFVVSGIGQALSGFVVDRIGPRRVLLAGIACFVLAALLLSVSRSYAMLLAVGALTGLGNSVFHPADFTVLNRKVSQARLGHAFSAHGCRATSAGPSHRCFSPASPSRRAGARRQSARPSSVSWPGWSSGCAARRRLYRRPARKSVRPGRRRPSAFSVSARCGCASPSFC